MRFENRKERETDEREISLNDNSRRYEQNYFKSYFSITNDYYSFRCSVYENRWEQMRRVTVDQIAVPNSLSSYLGPRIVTKIRGREWEGTGTGQSEEDMYQLD